MRLLIANSWISGISDMWIVGLFRKVKYWLTYKAKLGTRIDGLCCRLVLCLKNHGIPAKRQSGFLFSNNTLITNCCIDCVMEYCGEYGFKGHSTL